MEKVIPSCRSVLRNQVKAGCTPAGGYTIMQLMTDLEKNLCRHYASKCIEPSGAKENSTFENPLYPLLTINLRPGYRSSGEEVEGKWPIYPRNGCCRTLVKPLTTNIVGWDDDIRCRRNPIIKVATVNTMCYSWNE
jgi:hypothetical protein